MWFVWEHMKVNPRPSKKWIFQFTSKKTGIWLECIVVKHNHFLPCLLPQPFLMQRHRRQGGECVVIQKVSDYHGSWMKCCHPDQTESTWDEGTLLQKCLGQESQQCVTAENIHKSLQNPVLMTYSTSSNLYWTVNWIWWSSVCPPLAASTRRTFLYRYRSCCSPAALHAAPSASQDCKRAIGGRRGYPGSRTPSV